jgi:predicted enzyme related to lactoylglutathione lyase
MSRNSQHPARGQVGYLQLPALDIATSAAFYEQVFGWQTELTYGSFEAPDLIGQWTTERAPTSAAGPVLWICADDLYPTLDRVQELGGTVVSAPSLDQGERWLAEVDDPAGNRIGIVVQAGPPAAQPMLAVADVEASSRWYATLLDLVSDHGGSEYERLLSGGTLALQLHHHGVEHHHGLISHSDHEVGNGVLLWFGDVADFDAVVQRADELGATVVRAPHRNPPTGQGNGPGHREIWLKDLDGYTVVVASQDGEAYE